MWAPEGAAEELAPRAAARVEREKKIPMLRVLPGVDVDVARLALQRVHWW
jgi:hypothetical protein